MRSLLQLCKIISILCYIDVVWAGNSNMFCQTSPCLELLLQEFEPSKVTCNFSVTNCPCSFRILDLTTCVVAGNSSTKSRFNFSFIQLPDQFLTNKYTASCIIFLQNFAICDSQIAVTYQSFRTTVLDRVLVAMGVFFEILSGLQVVRKCCSAMPRSF